MNEEHKMSNLVYYETPLLEQINNLKQQLKDKDEKISKIYEIKKDILTRYKLQDGNDKSREFYYMQCIDLILKILESNKED